MSGPKSKTISEVSLVFTKSGPRQIRSTRFNIRMSQVVLSLKSYFPVDRRLLVQEHIAIIGYLKDNFFLGAFQLYVFAF